MWVEGLETTNTSKSKSKTLYGMVQDMWYDRNKVAPYVAESVWVCSKGEYNRALAIYRQKTEEEKKVYDPKDLHTQYNIEIGKKVKVIFEKWGNLDLWKLDNQTLYKFPSSKQKILQDYCGFGKPYENFAPYIKQMDDKQKAVLSEVSDEDFSFFIREKAKYWKDNMMKWSDNMNTYPTLEQIANITQVENFYKDFEVIKKKYNNVTWYEEKDIIVAYEALPQEKKDAYAKVYGNDKHAMYKAMELEKNMPLLEESWIIDDMTQEEKDEYYALVKRYYEHNESVGLGKYLKESWWNFYDRIKDMVVDVVDKKISTIDEIKQDVADNEIVKWYFSGHMTEWWVWENDKDFWYYKGLINIYPILKNDPKIQELIKIENPKEEEKKEIMEYIKTKAEWADAEGNLLEETQEVVKGQAISSCLDMLRMYMDIDLNEEENILDQMENTMKHDLKVNENNNGNENIVLQINGKVNGKNMKIYYNLTTGKLQQEEFLSRWSINTPYSINDSVNWKKDISGVQLPKFEDFINWAKNINYASLVRKSEDLSEYKKMLWGELKQQVKKEWTWDIDMERVRCERSIMKNIVAQEVFLFMEQNIDESISSFSSTNNTKIYDMYSILYNSFDTYTIDELKDFRKNIALLYTHKNKYLQYNKEKWTNNAKYALWLLGESDVNHVDGKKINKQNQYEQNEYEYLWWYADFFSIFKDKSYSRPIIDPISFNKFTYNIGLEISNDQEYFRRDDMRRRFDEFVDTDKLSSLQKLEEAYA